jgi:hypothetical protein
MPSAKEDFILRISSLEQSLSSNAVKNEILIPEYKEHNEIARMLRNGLAVVGFAALEDFVKRRASEVASQVGSANVAFYKLPIKLQNAATYEVVRALNFQLNHRNRPDKIAYIQEQALKVASTSGDDYKLSEHIFGYDQSNVTSDTISRSLGSFHIDKPWNQMQLMASRLGLTGLPLEETFKSAAQRRHRAAHVASADTPESELRQYIKEAYAIGISFDLLLTKALKEIQAKKTDYLNGKTKVQSVGIPLRIVKYVDQRWKEFADNASRATKASLIKAEVMQEALRRSRASNEALIEFDEHGKIAHWYF